MSRVFLFDIDGTLLSSGQAGQYAMEETLRFEFGLEKLEYQIATAGRTDRAIISDLFEWHKIEFSEILFEQFRDRYFSILPKYLGQGKGMLLPGVCELLTHLTTESNEFTGLLTGNFETSGWMKVRHFEIDHHFSFGAFGDRHRDRNDVARLAIEHLQRQGEVDPENIWVIGDTPADIQCARAIGANVLAVATGHFSREELQAAQPDALVDSFQELEEVVEILTA